ncbi:MAG: prepilin-type N-terminal cleavage/methylation domain-containing protein [Rhodobacteraceae bacterium]|nr:prepilin-type N-terminal cleavage/methylation domain-containing protein [Paracoccaceae bacterium]
MKNSSPNSGFTLVEVMIALLLLSGGFIILLQALNTGNVMRTKSELLTQQSVLMNDKIQEIRSRRFDENTSSPWSSTLGTDSNTDAYLSFDGNDWVTTPIDADLQAMPSTTWSGWIKPTGISGWQIIFGMEDGGWDRFLIIENGGLGLSMGITSNRWQTGKSVTAGVWQHVVAIYDNGSMRFYHNGIEFTTSSAEGNHSSNGTFTIGANQNGGYNFYTGLIDEVAVWDEALTASEITTLYNSGEGINASTNSGNYTSSTNLVGYYKMDNGQGSIITDQSGHSNNGTISGATWVTSSQANDESTIPLWDDIDDFNLYSISEIPNQTAFGCTVKVDYVQAESGFHTAVTGPTDYKRVMVEINHKTIPALRDTFIVSPGL